MKHQKNAHNEKVRQCTYFNAGKYNYRQYLCWFNHNEACRKLYANIVIRLLSCEQISCSTEKNIMVSFFQTVLISLMAIVTIHLVDLNKHKKRVIKGPKLKMIHVILYCDPLCFVFLGMDKYIYKLQPVCSF